MGTETHLPHPAVDGLTGEQKANGAPSFLDSSGPRFRAPLFTVRDHPLCRSDLDAPRPHIGGKPGAARLLEIKQTCIDDAIGAILILNTLASTLGLTLAGAQAVELFGEAS